MNFGDALKAGKTFLIIRGGDSLIDQFFHLVPVGLAPGGGFDLRDLGDCQYGLVFLEDASLPVLFVDSVLDIHMSSDRSVQIAFPSSGLVPGVPLHVEASSDLRVWARIQTFSITEEVPKITFTDSAALLFSERPYRRIVVT